MTIMSSNIEFDEIFAVRILLQDDYQDENEIIRELKYELIQRGMSQENIPNYLKEFYEAFGFNITLEQINEALQPSEEEQLANQFINVVNQLVNGQIQYNNVQNNNVQNNNVQDNNDNDEDTIDGDDESLGSDNEDNNQDISGNNIDASGNLSNSILPSSVSGNVLGGSNVQFYISTMGPGGNAPHVGTTNLSLNTLLGSLLNQNPSMILPPLPPHQMMLQPLLGPLFQVPIGQGHVLQDVVSTLDDSEADKLKVYKSTEKKEEKCSVCMTDMNTDEQLCELPCVHTFHDDCIQPWLKEYNYKCPICRKEVGKPKYNV